MVRHAGAVRALRDGHLLVAVEPYPGSAPTVVGRLIESLGHPYFLAEFALAAIAAVFWRREGYPGLAVVGRITRQSR